MIGLFFDSVFWKGTYPMIGLFFDPVLGKGTYPVIGLFFGSVLGNDWFVLWFSTWEWLVCSLIQYLGRVLTPWLICSLIQYLGMNGLFFDSVFEKGTYPTLWEGYLPHNWSVLWFSVWEGCSPHPVGRVLNAWLVCSLIQYLGRVLTPPCWKGTYPTLCWNQHCLSDLSLVLLLPQLLCSLVVCWAWPE